MKGKVQKQGGKGGRGWKWRLDSLDQGFSEHTLQATASTPQRGPALRCKLWTQSESQPDVTDGRAAQVYALLTLRSKCYGSLRAGYLNLLNLVPTFERGKAELCLPVLDSSLLPWRFSAGLLGRGGEGGGPLRLQGKCSTYRQMGVFLGRRPGASEEHKGVHDPKRG